MSLFKELAKDLIDKNPPEPPKDYDVEKLKRKASIPQEPCVKHHWKNAFGDNRCRYCQMKYSYWQDVKRAIDAGNIKAEDWACKPHFHTSEVNPEQ